MKARNPHEGGSQSAGVEGALNVKLTEAQVRQPFFFFGPRSVMTVACAVISHDSALQECSASMAARRDD
jgi:hypothetical protein